MGAGAAKDKKFIQKLMAQLKAGKTELHVVDDKLGTPTYTHDFAANVRLLLERELWGLYNMVCGGITSRFEVAEEMCAPAGSAGPGQGHAGGIRLLCRRLFRPAAPVRTPDHQKAGPPAGQRNA